MTQRSCAEEADRIDCELHALAERADRLRAAYPGASKLWCEVSRHIESARGAARRLMGAKRRAETAG